MANEVKWFKFMNDMFDDDKIQYLESLPDGDTILIIWIKLLCLASKTNDDGSLKIAEELPYTSSLLANKFKKTPMQIEYAIGVMQKLGMICVIDEIIYVSNWAKYQSVDELAKIREQTRLRVQRYREKNKQIGCNVTETLKCNDFALISNSNNIILDNNEKEENKIKEERHKFGEYKKVLLTDSQYEKLISDFGEENVKNLIKELDEAKEMKGYVYKNDNLAIRKWVVENLKKKGLWKEVKKEQKVVIDTSKEDKELAELVDNDPQARKEFEEFMKSRNLNNIFKEF